MASADFPVPLSPVMMVETPADRQVDAARTGHGSVPTNAVRLEEDAAEAVVSCPPARSTWGGRRAPRRPRPGRTPESKSAGSGPR